MRSSERVLALIVLLIASVWASGCAAPPVYVRELPPAVLLEDCEEPVSTLETNKDLAQWALALRSALRVCNNDKQALRDWAKED